jgi:hypothetical protein
VHRKARFLGRARAYISRIFHAHLSRSLLLDVIIVVIIIVITTTPGKWISVMWTETGVWYDAEVLSIDVNNRQAQLWYPSDDAEDEALGEKEDINIEEAILDDEVSWPTDESKMRVTSEEAQKNAKRLKKERQKEKKSGGGASAASGKRLEQERREMQQKRDNVAKKFEESLNVAKAEEEAIGVTANAVENALNPSEIAIGIERALFERCGRDTGKEYGVHARSLMFNLRDPQNPTLRARVLHENVSAETLVKMTPAELANKELIEWRKKREEKIGEDAFLKGVPLEMIKVEKDGKGVSVHIKSKEEIEKEERGVETEGNTPAATPRVVPVGGNSNNNNSGSKDDDDDNPFASSEKEKTRLEKEDEKEEGEEEEKDDDDGEDDSAKEDFISFDAYQREEEGDEEEGDDEEEEEEEEEEEMERNAPATSKEKNTAEDDDDDDDGNEPGEIRPLEIGDWSGHVYVKGIDSLPAVALHFSPVGGELALLDKLLPDSSTLEIKGRVSLKDAEAFVRQIARQSNSRAVTIAEVETCMVNDKKQDASLLALAKHYEEKGRAGVSDDKEKKIEVYVFPRKSEEAMRLLKHMRAPGIVIRTENKKSGLIVAVIHKKGIGRNFKVIEAKAEKKRKEAKMKQLEIERAKKMKLLEAERLREAENYSPPDDGTSDFDEEFSEDDAEDRQEEEPRKPPPPPPKRVVTNNFGRGLTQTLVQPPPAPVVQQQQQQQQAPPPPPLVMAAAPQLHRQAPPPPPPVVAAAPPPQQQHRQAPPPPPRNAVVVPPPPTQLRVPPPPPIVHVPPPPPSNTNVGGDISQLLSSVSKFLPPQQQQQQQQQRAPPPPPRR